MKSPRIHLLEDRYDYLSSQVKGEPEVEFLVRSWRRRWRLVQDYRKEAAALSANFEHVFGEMEPTEQLLPEPYWHAHLEHG